MDLGLVDKDTSWWFYTIPAFLGSNYLLDFSLFISFLFLAILTWAFSVGGIAWTNSRNHKGQTPIPGPRGLPMFGTLFTLSCGLPHRSLASMASKRANSHLMAFSLGSTPVVVSSHPHTAKEILTSPHFADRPIKQSAKTLMFSRAIGFAPNGTYWRLLRKVASSHLFSPRRILAHESLRQDECASMIRYIAEDQEQNGVVCIRKHLQFASLNSIMGSVFGKRYDPASLKDRKELEEVKEMVSEGFELLGAFNWCDYLPWLSYVYDPFRINERCLKLVPRVRKFVRGIIDEHRAASNGSIKEADTSDFVDVLLSLDGHEKLQEDDMVSVLWEMIFRGTDTTALLTEWIMAELVLNPEVQDKLQREIDTTVKVKDRMLTDTDVAKLPYLQAVIKETLRIHPPGPLLSWARLSTSDVQLSNGMVIPSNTTAMVNMWAITHDPQVWANPNKFRPERFIEEDLDVRGGDLRLAPFGAGRRVCPGKNLGLATVALWVAKMVHRFKWVEDSGNPVDLSEVLKLSCEMKYPLRAVALERRSSV
ncbi:cytochrome P450 78A7-like [Euphorbia lathyris]|uniref:cytochrome P450 78A7-like n=1 Tax=Euphorbia lathyris TaxID=212925 RepID=UPI0033144123